VSNHFWAEGGEDDTLFTLCVKVIISMA
jgi:hypothetical protein